MTPCSFSLRKIKTRNTIGIPVYIFWPFSHGKIKQNTIGYQYTYFGHFPIETMGLFACLNSGGIWMV